MYLLHMISFTNEELQIETRPVGWGVCVWGRGGTHVFPSRNPTHVHEQTVANV